MGRKNVRDVLFKLIFENLFVDSSDSVTYEEFIKGEPLDFGNNNQVLISDIDSDNLEYFKENYLSVLRNKTDILNLVAKHITGYTIDNMFKIDLAILVMSVNELVYYKKTPVKIVANEAVELAKKYSTDKSSSFVNGILAGIIKDLDIK